MSEPVAETITIATLEQKKSKTGKPFWTAVDSGGEYYSVWEPTLVAQLAPNTPLSVMVEHKESGGKIYRNIVAMAGSTELDDFFGVSPTTPITLQRPQKSPPLTPGPAAHVPSNPTGIRVAALKMAVTMIVNGKAKSTEWIDLSDKFVRYINNTPNEQQISSHDALDPTKFVED